MEDIAGVAVTTGPGLEPCLIQGANYSLALAREHNLPFVVSHHLEGHIAVAILCCEREGRPLNYPFITLLVSGGHSQFILCNGLGNYSVLGGTLDDSIGEAYDKVARMLELDVSSLCGGEVVETLARESVAREVLDGVDNCIKLPIPMKGKKNFNLSYAGLKNAVRIARDAVKKVREDGVLTEFDKQDICASFQKSAVEHLVDRMGAVVDYGRSRGVNEFVVVGGVARNEVIRRKISRVIEKKGGRVEIPSAELCTDNGVMPAYAGIQKFIKGASDDTEGDVDVYARWPFREDGAWGEQSTQSEKSQKLAAP
jgi:N6-L-threonylcarbamoyladenine synthase